MIIECHFKTRFSVDLCYTCGLLASNVIGPLAIKARLTAPKNKIFERKKIPLQLEDVPLETQRECKWNMTEHIPISAERSRNFGAKIIDEDS